MKDIENSRKTEKVPGKFELSNDLASLEDAVNLHDKIFGFEAESTYSDKAEWQRRIDNGGYFVTSKSESDVVGFVACDTNKEGEFRIWLAGVDPEFRDQGIWSSMYEDVVQHAKDNNYKHILINTFPDKFPMMFSFLQKIGAEIYKEEEVHGLKKVYGRITI